MKLIDNILFIEFSEAVEAGIPDNTIKSANLRKAPSWNIINDPSDARKVLIGYENLSVTNKEKINKSYGNPYEFIAKAPIRKLVTIDFVAEQFYRDYRITGSRLPADHQQKYVTAASWLNMMTRLNEDKKFIKKELNISLAEFWANCCDIIKSDKIALPSTYQRLREKMLEYKETGFECLIETWRFGNKFSAKIGKSENGFDEEIAEKQQAFIIKAASMHNNYDAMQITRAVNPIFEKQGWPTISHGTVYNVIRATRHLTTPGARGKREYMASMAMQAKRTAPQFPLQYITLDGWTVELLFQNETGYNNRLVAVIVLDPCCKYPLGYAIGDRENSDLIRQANRNAAHHIQELFGNTYRPRQIQSDNYGIKGLSPFYEAMAKVVTPAAVGNAKAKVIEPYFMYLNKEYCQRSFKNWSGFNINSQKRNQPNIEFLDMIKKDFPDRAGVEKQIHAIIARERELKIEEYQARWELLPVEDRIEMRREDILMVYGQSTGYTNKIYGQGLLPTIQGTKYTYDSFDPAFRALAHLNWQVIFDEKDLSTILAVSEDNKHRFVLEQKRELPMAIHDMVPEDHAYLSRINSFNKDRVKEIMDTYEKNDAIVAEVMESTPLNLNDFDEAALKLMFTYKGQQKERLQDAKGLKQVTNGKPKKDNQHDSWQLQQQQYLQSKTDFNQYLD